MPPMLPDRKPPAPQPGWAIGTPREDAQALLAFCMELLCAAKLKKQAAARQVAAMAIKVGVLCEDGAPPTWQQIDSWRAEIRKGRAPASARKTFEALRADPDYAAVLTGRRDEGKRAAAEHRVRAIVHATAQVLPRAMPKRRERGR